MLEREVRKLGDKGGLDDVVAKVEAMTGVLIPLVD